MDWKYRIENRFYVRMLVVTIWIFRNKLKAVVELAWRDCTTRLEGPPSSAASKLKPIVIPVIFGNSLVICQSSNSYQQFYCGLPLGNAIITLKKSIHRDGYHCTILSVENCRFFIRKPGSSANAICPHSCCIQFNSLKQIVPKMILLKFSVVWNWLDKYEFNSTAWNASPTVTKTMELFNSF